MRAAAFTLTGLLVGCAPSIAPNDHDAAPGVDASFPAGPVATISEPDGSFRTRIDATSETDWRLVDLSDGSEGSGAAWDLRARRFHLSLNGGVSGDAGVELVAVAVATIEEIATIPTTGWITDAPDGDDENPDPDYAFAQGEGWYAYDGDLHVLTPLPVVWLVRTRTGSVTAVDIESYYDDVGTSAVITIRWKPIGATS